MAEIFWWIVFPYLAGVTMILGSLYRFAYHQISWTAPSTEFFEKKWLKIGSPLFHYGILLAIIGHLMGMVVPKGFYDALGISSGLYHIGAIIGGGIAGLMIVVGIVILFIRKVSNEHVRFHARFGDYFALIALMFVAGTGTYMTIIYNTTVISYEYRETIGPWFRSLFILQPDYQIMSSVPLIFKIHVISAFAFFASIPFIHVIHFFSTPVGYPTRAPQQYRSRSSYKKTGNE